jgi:hypothetical protein
VLEAGEKWLGIDGWKFVLKEARVLHGQSSGEERVGREGKETDRVFLNSRMCLAVSSQ